MTRSALRHICPHCGAAYRMTESSRHCRPTYHTVVCSCCGDVLAAWVGCARHYRRLKRPSPVTRAAKIVAEAAAGSAKTGKLRRARSETSSGRRTAPRKLNA